MEGLALAIGEVDGCNVGDSVGLYVGGTLGMKEG